MIEIAVASIPFAIIMYLILKNREQEEKFTRLTENDTQDDTQDTPENDVNDANGTDTKNIEDLSQKERNTEIEPVHCKTDKENLPSAPSKRNDMLVLLVYYYQTIVKIIELIMSKRALRNRRSRRDNYESMLPLSRSSKESDLLSPTAIYEETKADDTDEDQDLDDEFEMQHQEASMENLEVFIAQRRKLETYLQQYDGKKTDIELSEEVEIDESDIAVTPSETINTENENIISDIEKALLIESEQVALLIDESPCEESESDNLTENSLTISFDEIIGSIEKEDTSSTKKTHLGNKEIFIKEEKQVLDEMVPSLQENEKENNVTERVIEIDYSTKSVPTKENKMSDNEYEISIAQRRKLDTYLQHYDSKENKALLSEDEIDMVLPPHDSFKTECVTAISNIKKALLLESEQVPLSESFDESSFTNVTSISGIDKALFLESEQVALSERLNENIFTIPFDKTVVELDNKETSNTKSTQCDNYVLPNDEKQGSSEILTSLQDIQNENNVIERIIENDYDEPSVQSKESEISEYDITLKEFVYNYDDESEITDTLINETLNDNSKDSQSSDVENLENVNFGLRRDYLCSDEKNIENDDMLENNDAVDEIQTRCIHNKNNAPPINIKQMDYDSQNTNEICTKQNEQMKEITQDDNISESDLKIKGKVVLQSKDIENIIPTPEIKLSEETNSLKDPVNINQEKYKVSNAFTKESQNRVIIGHNIPISTIEVIDENSKKSDNRNECETEVMSITTLNDKSKSDSDMQSSLTEETTIENIQTENISSNEDFSNLENNENLILGIDTSGDTKKLDINSKLEFNPPSSDQEFENLYKESIQISDENATGYEETLLNETFNTDSLSKDIDSISKTSTKKSFRNKGKRRKCNHKAAKKNKASNNENEDDNNDESSINIKLVQSDLQSPYTEQETEDVQPLTPEVAVSLDKVRKYGQVSEYILLKEIEQVESLIREAVAENSDLSDSLVESFFIEENNNSEYAESFNNESRILEPIKEETVEDKDNIPDENFEKENLCFSDDINEDENSVVITNTISDNNEGKRQYVYDFEEAYAVCEYEEVTEDVYETFCDESDFMVPVIKRDDEWWATLTDRDASQFETVGDKNKEFYNMESIPETKKKGSVPKKVSFRADNELATVIVENIDRENFDEYKETSTANTDNYFDNEIYEDNNFSDNMKSFFNTEVSDLMMELDTYDDMDLYKNDDIDRVLSSYETLGNLVAVDEYETQTNQTKHDEECVTELPDEYAQEDKYTEEYRNINDLNQDFDHSSFIENTTSISNSYNKKLDVYNGEQFFDFYTITSLDECKAFEAKDNNSDELCIPFIEIEGENLDDRFDNLSNIDECAAFRASEECDLIIPKSVDSIADQYSPNHVMDDSAEIVNEPPVHDTFLDESFIVSKDKYQFYHPSIYQASSIYDKNKEIKPLSNITLIKTSRSMPESDEKMVKSYGNEILYNGCLSNHEDETEEELFKSFGDRLEVSRIDLEIGGKDRINHFDEDITQIDRCKAFSATSEPSVIEEAVVLKIKELEDQMKAIESCLNSPDSTSDSKLPYDQTGINSTTEIFDEEIQNVSYSTINTSVHECSLIVSYEGSSENMKNEGDWELLESDISQSKDDTYKEHPKVDIHLLEKPQEDILLDKYTASHANEELIVNKDKENDYEIMSTSLAKIDQCTAFEADEFNIESTGLDSEKDNLVSNVKYFDEESAIDFGRRLFIASTILSEVDTEYDLIDQDLSQSNIDQCKAFQADYASILETGPTHELLDSNFTQPIIIQSKAFPIDCVENDIDKIKLISVEEYDAISAKPSAQYIPDVSPFVQYSLEQCREFYAEEIQLCTNQLKEEENEYDPVTYEQNREEKADKDHIESPITCYSKIDQCKAFNADTSGSNSLSVYPFIPSLNTSINLPVLTLSKEESDYTLSVRLEKFKSLDVLQAASISQDESSYKVSYE